MTTLERAAGGDVARDALDRSRELVTPALRAAVDTLPDPLRHIAGYHLGWWDEHGTVSARPAGKSLRPALVLLAAEAVGGGTRGALPAAVAVELVHNFSLLHDDVMDGDRTRRHRRTAWAVFGIGPAILAGDALLSLACDVLAGSGHPAAIESVRTLNRAVCDLLDGQSADLAFERRTDVTLAECLRMAAGKTGALLGCAAGLGAAYGGGTVEQAGHLRVFGERLGLAFQVVDDLLGIWGDPAVTGKPVHADLHQRKKSLPVVAALTSGTPAGAELAALYRSDQPLSAHDLAHAAELVRTAGGRAWSEAKTAELLTEAMHRLAAAGPQPRSATELGALARLATHRDH